ncbi:hypothetical protein PL11_006255 [Lentilactobacillus curieae]|uniref:SCP domain-containing protein n=1 Tax=Lentilactobacillus curieae TaxID=1138822 RepID=A0A1S6QIY1_9LACO|nr:CAP domain-containing protein [Lentilactobacillus curieae]AQW21560.1 hypothetical protein PL11_006255 [Lentilactobacillus curieae]
MKFSKLLVALGMLVGVGLAGVGSAHAQVASKRVTVQFKSTTGKNLQASRTFYLPNDGVSTVSGSDQLIKGYIPYDGGKTYTYKNCPRTLTIRYSKLSTVATKVGKYYMQQINAYRVTQGLAKLRGNSDLKRKATVRANELWIQTSHTRPNGESYNTKNSGYAEVMAVFPSCFHSVVGSGAYVEYRKSGTLDYKETAATASNELLTIDAQHRDTELNTWSKYSEVAFSFKPDGSGMMAQLFKL